MEKEINLLPKNIVLVIIDVQDGFDEPGLGKRNNPNAESNVVRLLEAWRESNRPVMYVKHNSVQADSPLHPSHPGNAIKQIVKPLPDEPVFTKSVNSAFIGTNLEEELRKQNFDTLVMVGLTTNYCVSTSVRMAGNLGFKTFVVSDATAAFDTVDHNGKVYTAEEIHNVSLANLHKEFATVLNTEEILAKLNGNF